MELITDADFQSIGFELVKVETLTIRFYRMLQYTLTYDTVTNKVCVVYGSVSQTYDTVYVSIVTNFGDLTANLIKNGVITMAPGGVC